VKNALHALMPAVVSEGTASGVGFPAGTAGKTGTAEYGEGENLPTHAWFIGYRKDVAFAVIVEGGGTGAEAAAPVAAQFLRQAS
jgi:cell division protein FtsI/penicillin-binding protein 2